MNNLVNLEFITIEKIKLPYQDKTVKISANFGSLEKNNNFSDYYKAMKLDTKIYLFVDEQKKLPLAFREEYKGQQIRVVFFNEEDFEFSTDWRSKYFKVKINLSWLEIIEEFSNNWNGPTIDAGESYKRK